ncbi:unnamed protein product [Moneuplotes crassus]|uniref:Uncharacterized protein n=2 Tax=Euplotes crassus TaxID=5936 RepID=A0AAD1XFK1_EUPCR|nr:unnamed protein product [Moneuplotes crassus]
MADNKKFVALRNKLSCLHYSQPLSKESCPLIEKMLGDLLATTELYQRTKVQLESAESQIRKEQIALIPLKKDNARIVKENNALHKEMIQVKENLSQNDNNWQRQFKQLESEYNDIKQASLAKNFEINSLKKRNLKLEERLDNVMSKAYKPNVKQVVSAFVQPEDGDDIGTKQNMELTYMLERQTNREIETAEEENLINQICEADERVQIMTKELEAYKQFKDDTESRIKDLESMIIQRDREISRLNNLYTGEETVTQTAFYEKDNKETIAKLNGQLDYINKENRRLQSIIDGLKARNKSSTGMYKENIKVVNRIEKLKETNDDLRRMNETCENTISTLKEREGELTSTLSFNYVDKNKYLDAIQTIDLQQQENEKLKKLVEALENQKKLETLHKLQRSLSAS